MADTGWRKAAPIGLCPPGLFCSVGGCGPVGVGVAELSSHPRCLGIWCDTAVVFGSISKTLARLITHCLGRLAQEPEKGGTKTLVAVFLPITETATLGLMS